MKTLQFVRLLFLRDLRRQRLRLFLLLLSLVAMILIGVDARRELTYLPALSHVTDLLVLLVAISLIRSDPPERELCLLGVLPVPWYAPPLAKSAFVFLMLILPIWAVRELLVFRVGIPMRGADHLALFVDVATGYGWFIGGAVIVAALLPWLWLILLALPVAFGVGIFLASLATEFWSHAASPAAGPNAFTLLQSQEYVLGWGIGLTAIATAFLTYATRRPMVGAFVAILGFGVAIGFSPVWPIDFWSQAGPGMAATSEGWDHLKISPVPASAFTSSNWPSEDTTAIYGPFTITGLAAPYFAEPDVKLYHATATLSSLRAVDFNGKDFHSFVGGSWEPPNLLPSLAGLAPPTTTADSWPQSDIQVFGYHPSELKGEDLTDAKVRGALTVQIKRLRVIGTILFRDEAALALPRERIEVHNISRDGEPACDLTFWQLLLPISGNESTANVQAIVYVPGSPSYIVLAFAKDLDYATGTDDRITAGENTFILTSHLHFARTGGSADSENLPADWFDHAQISFVVTDNVGRLDVPYEVDDINLGAKAGN